MGSQQNYFNYTGKKTAPAAKGSVSKQLEKFQQMGVQKKENLAVTSKQASHLHKSIISSLNIKRKDIINLLNIGNFKWINNNNY